MRGPETKSNDAWDAYDRWNSAVAATIYPEIDGAGPAYLDLEDEALAAVAKAAGFEGDPKQGLCEAVAAVVLEHGKLRLNALTSRRRGWMQNARTRREPPPVLAFLAVTVLAAEAMGSDESPFAKHAYYPWLAKFLGLGSEKPVLHDVQTHYSERAEDYWGTLNWWLEGCDGRRGLPTAYALSHRYVGIPLSQALLRDGDRRAFPRFYVKYGLAPGMDIGGQDLEAYLGEWLGLESCPVSSSLKKLWAREATRERIADLVALELTGWDGSVVGDDEESAASIDSLKLLAELRQGYMGSALNLMLATYAGTQDEGDFALEVRDASDEWRLVDFARATGNLRVLPIDGVIDGGSLLAGVAEMRDPDDPDGAPKRRHSRAIIPLVLDEVQQAFVERERIQLNADSMLLVSEQGRNGSLVGVVERILNGHARPGWTKLASLSGLPEGWVLFTRVQLFAAPLDSSVTELVPLARDLLTVGGGIRIPSRIRKWSTAAPPEIRVSLQRASQFEVHVTSLANGSPVRYWQSDDGALVARLDEDPLDPGDYRVELRLAGSKDPIQQVTLRLRSGNSQEDVDDGDADVSYGVGHGPAALAAIGVHVTDGQPHEVVVTGAHVDGDLAISPGISAPNSAVWMERREATTTTPPTVHLAEPDPKSCVRTGAHYLQYPTFGDGPKQKYISGTCKYCGVVKRSPGWAWKANKTNAGDNSLHAINLSDLPPVSAGTAQLWAGALDAIRHVGAGSSRDLQYLSNQIDPGAIFGGTLAATFESLGHVDIERETTGSVMRWSVVQGQIAVRTDGAAELLGYWPSNEWDWLRAVAAESDITVDEREAEGQPPRRTLSGLPDGVRVAADKQGIKVIDDPCWRMMRALPPLSEVAAALPTSPLPGFTAAERFDADTASWAGTHDVDRPGAYRLVKGYERIYVVRSAEHVQNGTSSRTSVHVAKHIGAGAEGRPLTVYLESEAAIIVPMGCDLPGLYGRAAVLGSGGMPRSARVSKNNSGRKILAYTGINRPSADLLHTLLSA